MEAIEDSLNPRQPEEAGGPPPSSGGTSEKPSQRKRLLFKVLFLLICIGAILKLEESAAHLTLLKASAWLIGSAVAVLIVPWRILDEHIVARCLCLLSDRFSKDQWRACVDARLRIARVVLYGLVLIILLPFGLLWTLVPGLSAFQALPSPRHNIFELWELAVCAWSVLFMFFVFFVDHPEHYKKRQDPSLFTLGVISSFGWLAFSILVVYLILFVGRDRPELRILGELLIVALFCTLDFLLYRGYVAAAKRSHGQQATEFEDRANEFLQFLLIVDGPALLGFLVLEAYLLSAPVETSWASPFVAGASAFSLIVVNTVYFFMYWRERYLGLGGSNRLLSNRTPAAG